MKIKSLLIGMLACSAMVACTNTDEPNVKKEQQTTEKANGYMSVKLIMTESIGGRAATDGGYDKGTTDEQKIDVNKSIFLFYDANGKYVASGDLKTSTMNDHESSTHEGNSYGENYKDINDIHGNAFIAISAPNDDIKAIKQVLTVVNYPNVSELDLKNLDQVLYKITNTAINPDNSGFLMTTSAYIDSDKSDDVEPIEKADGLIYTTAISEDNIKATQEAALADGNYVEIYIERASAKVELLFNGQTITTSNTTFPITPTSENSGDINKESDLLVDGNLTSASIEILGWKVNNVNDETYLVKKIDQWINTNPIITPAITGENATEAVYFTSWNNAKDHRSYWAEGTLWENTDGTNLEAFTFDQAKANNTSMSTPMYCYEQTVETPVAARGTDSPNVTTVLIAAKIKFNVKDGNSEVEYAGDLFNYAGVMYTETGYKNIILQKLADAGYTKTDAQTALTLDDIEIAPKANSLAGIEVTVKSGTYLLKGQASSKGAIDATIATLPYVNAEGYKTGYCYYQIPIEHLTSATANPFYGVVRNHWYKLDITKVTHIGEAVYNPGVEIPQIPPKDVAHYLATKIHVLSWHVVKQNVTLD